MAAAGAGWQRLLCLGGALFPLYIYTSISTRANGSANCMAASSAAIDRVRRVIQRGY